MNTPNPSLLANLNDQQLAAITWPDEPCLVLAGAGSGKTRVLTTRIAWLLHNHRASSHSILAVTFTNKAAKEMQARLGAMVPFNVRAMWMGTFHGLCHRFLRLHAKDANLPSTFQILDSSDQLSMIKRLLKEHQVSEDKVQPRSLQGFISSQKEAGFRASMLSAPDAHMKLMIQLFDVYDQQCQREGVVDFSELLLRSYEVLANNEALRTHYQNRFSHILVDEFQDTNKLQYKWLKLLAGPNTALFAVGDDDQSIYAFRGANVGNMNDLMREFNIEAPIKLEQNYRSVGNILAAANAVIEHNDDRLGKNLHTEAGDGEKIRLHFANNDFEEAQLVCDEAKSLEREGWALSNMAILYRSNAQSRVIEQILFRAGVPYKIYGGLRFFERQEIKHALAYLRLVANEHDDNALLRVINVPARGIGTRSVEALQALAQTHGVSLWQAACMQAQNKPASKIGAFILLVDALKQVAQSSILPDLMREVIHQSGLYGFYENNPKESQDRLDNLNELISAATTFDPNDVMFEAPEAESTEPVSPLLAFLSNAALESGEHQAIEGVEALQMMTIHAAKGLEFDAVFLTGLEEGLFPSEYSLAEHGGLAEERRLMYVAITRARKRLYLSAAQQRMLHGKTHFGLLSRFIDEIPPVLVHKTSATYDHADVAYTNPYQKPRTQTTALAKNLKQTQTYAGFEIGQNVRHAKFGTGVIIDAEANGDSAKLHINFGREGVKWLDTQYANLEAV